MELKLSHRPHFYTQKDEKHNHKMHGRNLELASSYVCTGGPQSHMVEDDLNCQIPPASNSQVLRIIGLCHYIQA